MNTNMVEDNIFYQSIPGQATNALEPVMNEVAEVPAPNGEEDDEPADVNIEKPVLAHVATSANFFPSGQGEA